MSVLSAIRPLVRSEEDLATLALAHVLHESAPARESMNRLLGVDSNAGWSPQHVLGDEELSGRPDLAATVGADRVAFIEAKFDAGLTAAQPTTYLEALPGNGHLAMLVPTSRTGYISRELIRRVGAAGARLEQVAHRQWKVHFPARPTRRLSVLTWDDVVSQLLQATEGPEARAAHQDLLQIEHLVQAIESTLYVPFSSEQLTSPEIPRAAIQILDLLKLLREALLELGWTPSGKYTSTIDGWTAYTMQPPGRQLGWSVHQSWSAWLEHASTPLWLTLAWDDRERYPDLLRPWLSEPTLRGYHFTNWNRSPIAVPLHIPVDGDRAEAISALVDQVERTAEHGEALLKSSGPDQSRP